MSSLPHDPAIASTAESMIVDSVAPIAADSSSIVDASVPQPKARIRGRRRADADGPIDTSSSCSSAAAATPAASAPSSRGPVRLTRVAPSIPSSLLSNPLLAKAIAVLPSNYNFEIYKTIWRLGEAKAKMVGLQFPEGLLMYACVISDILQEFALVSTLIMGDVTYGACCVDDYTARALGCDFMVHYGHSCLVPIDVSTINMLYVFVDIAIDTGHLVRSLKEHIPRAQRIILAGTIQFATAIAVVAEELKDHFKELFVPQAKPLSKGEVLGCTSPKFDAYDAVIFVADGRFHLESMMIHNPHISTFLKYDPYGKSLTRERYDHAMMLALRKEAVDRAAGAKRWGLIVGTLGRQGNMHIIERLRKMITARGDSYVIVLLSEIFPDKLARFNAGSSGVASSPSSQSSSSPPTLPPSIDAWIQVACPRLSIDWGYAFPSPLLSTYEAEVALNSASTPWRDVYPMDYYSADGGAWSNYHKETTQKIEGTGKSVNPTRAKKEARLAAAAARDHATTAKIEIAYDVE